MILEYGMKKLLLICIIVFMIPRLCAARTLDFSGMVWEVKDGYAGPGPNNFSATPQSAWVDEQGRLHLKIRFIDNKWYCAEVYLQNALGYGAYRFVVDSEVDNYDPQIVIGLFTYLDDANEIDIEFARWGQSDNPVGQYVVQPYYIQGNKELFEVHDTANTTTHFIRWEPDRIRFSSFEGLHMAPAGDGLIHEWIYTGDYIPLSGDESVHINFWLFQGLPPLNHQEAEIIIRDFQFTPLDTKSVPALGNIGLVIIGGILSLLYICSAGRRFPS